MKKYKTLLLSALAVLLLGGISAGFLSLYYHVPAFYANCDIPSGKERKDLADRCWGKVADLYNNLSNGGTPDYLKPWRVDFIEKEVNSFLQGDYLPAGSDSKSLQRQGISDVRVAFQKDNIIRLGFRYGKKPWQTVMSFDMRVWLAPKDINVLAVELVARRAGALPVSAQSLLSSIAEQFHNKYVDISWWRNKGNPVALVRFQSDNARPNFQLRNIAVDRTLDPESNEQGILTLVGKSFDPNASSP